MPVSEYTPTVEEVAALLRARTKTRGGSEAGTFNPEAATDAEKTRPTEEQVDKLRDLALDKVSGVIGADIDADFHSMAKQTTALRTAMLIELSYFPEQVATQRSPYVQLKEMFDDCWSDLLSLMGIGQDSDGDPVALGAGYPSYGGFPLTALGMEQPL